MPPRLAKAVRMDLDEILWRSRAAARTVVDRARTAIAPARWNRRDLARRLARDPDLDRARTALGRSEWLDAHRELRHHLASGPARFVIAPSLKPTVASRIRREFPDSVGAAAARADRILAGEHDLLGFRGLRFDSGGTTDWHFDPVHDRRAPRRFWADVAYLDPGCGDHKIIWELNRHQHWLVLGRASWLTGNPKYRVAWLSDLECWLADNPPLVGINWASMLELALRSLSWIWAVHFFGDPAEDDSTAWIVDLLLGIDTQLAHVERNLSYYFSPNTHLLGEALALYVAGRSAPTAAIASVRRTITSTRSISTCSRSPSRASPATERRRISNARRRGWPSPPGSSRPTEAVCRISATTMAARCGRSRAAIRTTCATVWRWPARSSAVPISRSNLRPRRPSGSSRIRGSQTT